MSRKLRWGILGTGNIARQFSTGVRQSLRGELAVVGSRDSAKADAFASANGVRHSTTSYEALITHPDVDAVYVSLPNSMHKEWTVKALQAGKHVLCEKPMALNADETQEMFDAARESRRILMEAFMYRCHPQTAAIVETIQSGAIGEVRLIRTSFCFRVFKTERNIRFVPELGGGALMDVGCYCLSFSRLIAGAEPVSVQSFARLHPSGVDEVTAGTLVFPGDMLANFSCGFSAQSDNSAYICGTEGYIEIPVPWKPVAGKSGFSICRNTPPRMDTGGTPLPTPPPRQTTEVPVERDLYAYESDAFAATILDGAPLPVTPQDSIGNMKLIDAIRRQIGVKF